MSLSAALEPLVPTAASLVHDAIAHGRTQGRGALAYMLRVLPLLNREARDLWRALPGVPELLTFCAFLYPAKRRRDRYLDGVLFSDDREDPDGLVFDTPPKGLLDLSSIHMKRVKLAQRMDERAWGRASLPTDFYHAVWQLDDAFRKHPKYHQYFGECQRVGCSRPALLDPPPVERVDQDESSEAEYWKCCRDGKSPAPLSSLPNDMSFCCYGCFKITNAEFKDLVRFDIETPAASERRINSRSVYRRHRGGAAVTPTQLYRAAIQRNLAITRQMRDQPEVATQPYPSKMANREQLLRERTTMLSVDLGLLYVASLVHELPPRLKPNRPLPNRDNWRDHANCYLNAVCNVRTVYLQYGKGILARDSSELWMRRLRDQLLDIF